MRIFLPTDLKDQSLDVLNSWINIFDKEKTEISLIHIIEPSKGSGAIMIDISQVLHKEAVKKMEDFIDQLNLKLAKVDFKVQMGFYAAKMKEMVESYVPDFIAMNSQTKSGFDRIFEGQRAKKFIGSMPCPVLIIPDTCLNFNFKRFGLAIDEKDKLNEKTKSFIHKLEHYFSSTIFPFHIESKEYELMSYYDDFSRENNFGQVAILQSPSISDGINAFVASQELDSLILMTHKKGFIKELMDDNISKKIVGENHLPLFIINQ